jgi:hypothetical protein
MKMRSHFTGLTIAALLIAGAVVPVRAEDAAPPKEQPAAPAAVAPPPAAQPEAPPPVVPRPSIVPKTAEPDTAPIADTPPPARHRRYAHRHRHWRYRYAYWQPFPIFWPHFYHHRVYWSRMSWFHF